MNYSHLFTLLKNASRLKMTADAAQAAGAAVGCLVLAALAAVAADVVFALHPLALILADLVLVVLLVGGLGWLFVQVRRNWFHPLRAARMVEQRLGIRDSRLINAVEFSVERNSFRSIGDGENLERNEFRSTTAGSSASAALRQDAIERGETLASRLSAAKAIDWKPVRRVAAIAGGVALVAMIAWLAAPNVFARVVPRFLDPTGDHPPFTLVTFEVSVEPEAIYFGKPAKIGAKLGGPTVPEQAEVVFTDDGSKQRAAMLRDEEGFFVLPIERATASRRFYIDTPEGRSDVYSLTVLPTPRIESATIEYVYPEYTGWKKAESPLDGSVIRAIEGTKINFEVTANRPLKEGVVKRNLFRSTGKDGTLERNEFRSTDIVKLRPVKKSEQTVRGEFVFRESGKYSLSVRGADGAPGNETIAGMIECVLDKPPSVAIVAPEAHAMAVEGWKVEVEIQATDDVAVSRIAMFAGVNGDGPHPLELAPEPAESPAGVARQRHTFDLAAMQAKSGDVIKYHASAYDNRPDNNQFTDTPTHVIQVISQDEYLEFARTQHRIEEIHEEFEAYRERLAELAAEREQALARLEELQKKLAAGEELSAAEREEMQSLAAQLEEFADATEQLGKELAERAAEQPLYDFEKEYQQSLARLGEQLAEQSAAARDASQKLSELGQESNPQSPAAAARREALKQAAENFKEQNEPFDDPSQQAAEKTARDLAQLEKADELLAQANKLQAIVERQREIADRLGQFREQQAASENPPSADDLERMSRLAKEQDLLRQDLEETVEKLEQAADKAEDALPKMCQSARGICEAIRDMEIPGDQQSASKAGREGQGKDAFEAANLAAEKLASLGCEKCNGNSAGEEMGEGIDGPLGLSKEGLKKALEQMAAARGMPRFGQGKGGQKGNQPGSQPGDGQGDAQSGEGFEGQPTRMSVIGPPLAGQASQARSGRRSGDGLGREGAESSGADADGAESLTPESRSLRKGGPGSLRGVPTPYRDQAEAYFRRLAEEK